MLTSNILLLLTCTYRTSRIFFGKKKKNKNQPQNIRNSIRGGRGDKNEAVPQYTHCQTFLDYFFAKSKSKSFSGFGIMRTPYRYLV